MSKVAFIVGANQGLGYAAALQLADTGEYKVIIGSRNLAKGQEAAKARETIDVIQIDITDDASIKRAADEVEKKYGKLDVLVNNAGISPAGLGEDLRSNLTIVFNTNVFGHAVVTEAFLPLLKKSDNARIVFVSSSLGSLAQAKDDKLFSMYTDYLYRASKSALNMIAVTYAQNLKKDNITVTAVCPGYCKTNLNRYSGYLPAEDGGAALVLAVTKGPNEKVTGTFFNTSGEIPW